MSKEKYVQPHPTAESHREAMVRLRDMTPEQLLETSVSAGVHNPDGSIHDDYLDVGEVRLGDDHE